MLDHLFLHIIFFRHIGNNNIRYSYKENLKLMSQVVKKYQTTIINHTIMYKVYHTSYIFQTLSASGYHLNYRHSHLSYEEIHPDP